MFAGKSLGDITGLSLDTLSRLAAIDGALVINGNGALVNAGVILNVPDEHVCAGEGARTAAASFASTFGIAIKVSADGPITVYQAGRLIRRAA